MDSRILQIDMRRALRAVADLALPRYCIVCGRRLMLGEEHLCLPCLADLPETHHVGMSRNPMADKFNEKVDAPAYCHAAALFFYDDEAGYSSIPQSLKYRRNLAAGRYFAGMLGDALSGVAEFSGVDMVIPVPLHWTRRWKRGYNQAEVIAEAVAARLGAPCRTDILIRRKRTRTQTKLGSEAKADNVRRAFRVRKTVPARHILLIDDVFTSGSTLAACHSCLRAVYGDGARISVATLAYVGR